MSFSNKVCVLLFVFSYVTFSDAKAMMAAARERESPNAAAASNLNPRVIPPRYPAIFSEAARHQYSHTQQFHERQLDDELRRHEGVYRQARTPQRPPRIVGVFDGGGIKGLLQASLQRAIAEELGLSQKTIKLYDATGGTSVGSIMAAAAATESFSYQDVVDLLRENGPQIFPKSYWNKIISLGGLAAPVFSRKPLDTLLERFFSDTLLSEVKIPYCAVSSLQYENASGLWSAPEPHIFRSFDARNNPLLDTRLRDVMACSSAAPSYLAAYQFQFRGLNAKAYDGGLLANHPSLETVLHSEDCLGPFGEQDIILQYRTGYLNPDLVSHPGYITRVMRWMNPLRHGGIYEHAGAVFHSFMDGQMQRSADNARQVMPRLGIKLENIIELTASLTDTDMARTDEDYLQELEEAGQTSFEEMKRKGETEFLDNIRRAIEAKD